MRIKTLSNERERERERERHRLSPLAGSRAKLLRDEKRFSTAYLV